MIDVLKRIEEKCRQAKREIQSGYFDRPLKNKNRVKISLHDFSFGKIFLSDGGRTSSRGGYKYPSDFPKHRDYEISDFREE